MTIIMCLGLKSNFFIIISLTIFVVFTYNQFTWHMEYFLPAKISDIFSQIKVQPINVSEKSDKLRNISDNLRNLGDGITQSYQLQSTLLTLNSSDKPSLLIDGKSLLMQKVQNRFNERKDYLKKQCSVQLYIENVDYYKYFIKERMVYEHYHNFLVCLVAKNAATTWRRHLQNIRTKRKLKGRKKLSIKENEVISMSKDTIKVISVRHPVERLISTFRNKFGNGLEAPGTATKKIWYDAAEKVLRTSLGIAGNRVITFDIFVQVALKRHFRSDRHFRSVYSNCVPCKIDYDFIVHQETFSEDLSYLFLALNITESSIDVHINESRNKTSGRKPSELYLKELNSKQLVAIYDLLWPDFFLFDYPIPEAILNALKRDGRDLYKHNLKEKT